MDPITWFEGIFLLRSTVVHDLWSPSCSSFWVVFDKVGLFLAGYDIAYVLRDDIHMTNLALRDIDQ